MAKKIRRVLLRQGQCPGDILTMTRAVVDLARSYPQWELKVDCPAPEIWENCPYLVHEFTGEHEVVDVAYPAIHQSGWSGIHFAHAFHEDLESKLGVRIARTGFKPEIWISDTERGWVNQVEATSGWAGPFWLLNAGRKQDNELKHYPRWQEVVHLWNERFGGSVRLIQIGHGSHIHDELQGCYSLVGKTDVRQLIRLAYWASGTIGPISFQMVLSAALEQPAVVVAGGKEGVPWHLYPNMRWLYSNGALDCCAWDGCWKGGDLGACINQMPDGTPRCFALITPQEIVDAAWKYYQGGRLSTKDRGK